MMFPWFIFTWIFLVLAAVTALVPMFIKIAILSLLVLPSIIPLAFSVHVVSRRLDEIKLKAATVSHEALV